MTGATGPYMLVPVAEWEALNDQLTKQTRVLDTSHTTGQAGRDMAEAFLQSFNPAQMPPSWGHVAFCIERALTARRMKEGL